jgi:glucokinase
MKMTKRDTACFPLPCLLADVGGTHARFAILRDDTALSGPLVLETARAASFAGLVQTAVHGLGGAPPRSLIIAAAGPVMGRVVTLTNASHGDAPVHIDGPELIQALRLEQGLLLNDFEGLALSLPFLKATDLLHFGGGQADPLGPKVVVGPGTGLGVSALLNVGGRYLAIRSEGGHISLGDYASSAHTRVAEDLLSGRGLAWLHGELAGLSQALDPAAVGAAALAGDDPNAVGAVRMFLGLLGRFAGDMALTFCATGGVFIGGGITPKLAPLMDAADLRAQFEDKGVYANYMRAIPIALIRDPSAALHGLANIATDSESFLLDYTTRLWRAG